MVYAMFSIGILGFLVWSHHMFSVGLDVDKCVSTELHLGLYFLGLGEWEKILLYAGNSCISSPLVFTALGKIYLNTLPGQSAGNFSFSTKATAVTKNTYNSYQKLPLISEHVPKPNKVTNLNDNEFGYFLTGLIEGNGWFGDNELHIIFAENDISLAYLIKNRIGHGKVYKIKDKKAVGYICKNKKGLSIILSLINGKLVSKLKYEQLIKHNYSENFNYTIIPPLNKFTLDNYWLAGLTQADGCFYINVVKSKTQKTGFSVKLEFSIKQNDAVPLKLLYDTFKLGNISQYSSGAAAAPAAAAAKGCSGCCWCYKSSGFKTAAQLISYFDTFNIFAGKYNNYLKFRKVYIMITQGKHLEDKGIIKIKSIATKGSSETSTQEA